MDKENETGIKRCASAYGLLSSGKKDSVATRMYDFLHLHRPQPPLLELDRRDIADEFIYQLDGQLQADETVNVPQVELEMLPTEPAQPAFPVA